MSKFTINQKPLLAALTICNKAVNNGLVISTGSFRFKLENSKLQISTCNMEFSITKQLDIQSLDAFDILIPAPNILKLISSFADQPIDFIFDDGFNITIKSSSGIYKMQGYDGIDFPVIKTDSANEFIIPFEDITEALYKTSYARLIDDTGNRLNGLNIELTKSGLIAVGACAGRLSIYNIDGKYKPGVLLLPIKFVNSISALTLSGETKVNYSDNSISLELDGLTIKGLLMAEKYVDYRSVIPEMDVYITVNRQQLLSAVKRVLDFSNKDRTIIFNISDKLIITAADAQTNSEGEEVINIDISGNDIKIGNNGDFLIDALSHFSCDKILIYFESPMKPLMFKETINDINFSMVSPQQI
jgi:DNA polymerase-3 subunit beta